MSLDGVGFFLLFFPIDIFGHLLSVETVETSKMSANAIGIFGNLNL